MPFDTLCGALYENWLFDWRAMLALLQTGHFLVAVSIAGTLYILFRILTLRARQLRDRQPDIRPLPRLVSDGVLRPGVSTKLTVFDGTSKGSVAASVDAIERRRLTVSTSPDAPGEPRIGSTVELFLSAEGAGFRCTGVVQGIRKLTDRWVLQLTMPAWAERIQQRSHYRVRMDCGAIVSLIGAAPTHDRPYRARVRDFSAGGMMLEVPFQPPIGAMLRVRTEIDQLGDANFELRVLRTAPARLSRDGLWAASCEFLWMDEDTIDRLAYASLELQREKRRAHR
jgi:hypothetical protein